MFLFVVLAGLSLPGLSTFIGEFLALAGTFQRHPWAGVIATVSIVLAALYMLHRLPTHDDRAPAVRVKGCATCPSARNSPHSHR